MPLAADSQEVAFLGAEVSSGLLRAAFSRTCTYLYMVSTRFVRAILSVTSDTGVRGGRSLSYLDLPFIFL